MLASCGKDGKGRKEKSQGEKESEREPVPKTGWPEAISGPEATWIVTGWRRSPVDDGVGLGLLGGEGGSSREKLINKNIYGTLTKFNLINILH